ncbi:Crp/Fnr family transcriptional regulator [Alkalibacter mobilis]|uniref:Crp/Fnr family transcriptional regulator n=1 Tax=Alkalibacter mobilis TaxID=2787712 RepID=UPI00189FB432|nr:Crp/Fnr family transcriptional regulator [Alkalibacter mobilis]MBF7097240.1 Crp/Fnr family transcriptional regulator [Alkalibacter mobilis]
MQYYFPGDFSRFESYFASLEHEERLYRKNEDLKKLGDDFDDLFYILSGTLAASFSHESGKVKSYSFYGKGYFAPLYHPGNWEEMKALRLKAISNMRVYAFDRKSFFKYLKENEDLCDEMFRAYMNLVTFLILESTNQIFNSGIQKISNFLYIYLDNLNNSSNVINLTQYEIMEFVGLNRANLAKYLKILREKRIIDTQRNQLVVIDKEGLKEYCTILIHGEEAYQ